MRNNEIIDTMHPIKERKASSYTQLSRSWRCGYKKGGTRNTWYLRNHSDKKKKCINEERVVSWFKHNLIDGQ